MGSQDDTGKDDLPVVAQDDKTSLLPIEDKARPPSPMEMAISLKQSGLSTEDMKQMLELQKDYEANEARKEYNKAVAAFKADPPDITKNKKVAYKDVKYSHATLDHVASAISECMSEHGLSFNWKTNQLDGGLIEVICTMSHRMGHSESTKLSSKPDSTGSKNPIQSIGSTVTYLQRYTLLALTGMATRETDDDGAASGNNAPADPYITENQALDLEALIDDVGADKNGFLKMCKIEKIEDMTATKLPNAIKRLEEKRNATTN